MVGIRLKTEMPYQTAESRSWVINTVFLSIFVPEVFFNPLTFYVLYYSVGLVEIELFTQWHSNITCEVLVSADGNLVLTTV